tara:strand:+ start:2971 stop:3081 length:111 start_codon:yes stop_codon:yes gene_type:complete
MPVIIRNIFEDYVKETFNCPIAEKVAKSIREGTYEK